MSDGKREVTKTKELAVKPLQPFTLLEAIQANELKMVQQLVASGIDINAQLKGDKTALEIAARNETSDIFEYLLSQNPKLPNGLCMTIAVDSPWETAKKEEIFIFLEKMRGVRFSQLFTAATLGNLSKINELELKIETAQVSFIAECAAANGKINIIEWLLTLDIGKKNITTILNKGVSNGQLNMVEWFLKNYPHFISSLHLFAGGNILFGAACQRRYEVINFLLSKLSPVQKNTYFCQKNGADYTPLLLAADQGNLVAIKCLIEHGANIDDKTSSQYGSTALKLALQKDHWEIVKWIITRYPTKIHEKDANGMTPLHYAVSFNELEIFQYLVAEAEKDPSFSLWGPSDVKSTQSAKKQGGTAGGKDSSSSMCESSDSRSTQRAEIQDGTPLHYAARVDALSVVKWLVTQYPQNIDLVDNFGQTPLHYAILNRSISAIRYLIANGASLDHKDKRGKNALGRAIESGYAETLVPILISEFGANPNELDPESKEHGLKKHPEYLTLYREYFIKQKTEIYEVHLENLVPGEVISDHRKIFLEYICDDLNSPEKIEEFRKKINAVNEELFAPLRAHIKLGAQKPYKHKALSQQFMRDASFQYPCNPLTIRRAVVAFLELHKDTIKGSEFAIILNKMLEETDYLKESTEKQTPEAKELPLKDIDQQRSALLIAIKSHDAPKAKALLEKYPELYQPDMSGNTPLSYAAAMGQMEILKFLLSRLPKAEIHRKNKDDNTPLLLAVMNNQVEAMYLLLENGANIKDKNDMGMTVFLLIAQNDDHDTAQWLFSSRNTGISVTTLIQPLKNLSDSIIPYKHKELSRQLYETISDQKNILTIHCAVDAFLQKHRKTIKSSELEKILDKIIEQTRPFCDPKIMLFSDLAGAVGWFSSSPSIIAAPAATHQTTTSVQPPAPLSKSAASNVK